MASAAGLMVVTALLAALCTVSYATCGSADFTCRVPEAGDSTLCLPNTWRCDGEDDCSDGSDEEDCHKKISCPASQFACANGYQCVHREWRCDYDDDCSDASDEQGCDEEATEGTARPPATPLPANTDRRPSNATSTGGTSGSGGSANRRSWLLWLLASTLSAVATRW